MTVFADSVRKLGCKFSSFYKLPSVLLWQPACRLSCFGCKFKFKLHTDTHIDTDYLSRWLIIHIHNAAITGHYPQRWLSIVCQRLESWCTSVFAPERYLSSCGGWENAATRQEIITKVSYSTIVSTVCCMRWCWMLRVPNFGFFFSRENLHMY